MTIPRALQIFFITLEKNCEAIYLPGRRYKESPKIGFYITKTENGRNYFKFIGQCFIWKGWTLGSPFVELNESEWRYEWWQIHNCI